MQVDRFRYMFPVIAFEHSGDLFGLLSWGIKSDKSDKETIFLGTDIRSKHNVFIRTLLFVCDI